ncbi:hypothetical protein FB45DRAFT_906420, partial [Roridomyces roridus]
MFELSCGVKSVHDTLTNVKQGLQAVHHHRSPSSPSVCGVTWSVNSSFSPLHQMSACLRVFLSLHRRPHITLAEEGVHALGKGLPGLARRRDTLLDARLRALIVRSVSSCVGNAHARGTGRTGGGGRAGRVSLLILGTPSRSERGEDSEDDGGSGKRSDGARATC